MASFSNPLLVTLTMWHIIVSSNRKLLLLPKQLLSKNLMLLCEHNFVIVPTRDVAQTPTTEEDKAERHAARHTWTTFACFSTKKPTAQLESLVHSSLLSLMSQSLSSCHGDMHHLTHTWKETESQAL